MRTSLLWIALASVATGCGEDAEEPQPYGGEVRVEHVRNPEGGEIRRLSAFFIAAQDPDVVTEVPLGECAEGRTATWQASAREYIDVGESVTFHLGDADVVLPRMVTDPDNAECSTTRPCAEGVTDFRGRLHDIAYQVELLDGPYGDDFLMAENSVTTAEPQSFSDRLRVVQPPVLEVSWPGDTTWPVELQRRQDVELAWTQTQPIDDLNIAIELWGDDGRTVTCRSADTGHFTVPAAVMDGFATETGMVTVYSVNRARAVTDDGRAIDVLAEYHGNLMLWHLQ